MKLCQRCGLVTGDRAACCPEDGGSLSGLLPGPPLIDERYRLLRCLGRGGMGLVFAAEHLVLKRQVAVKIVRPDRLHDERARARFRTEAEALGRLEHPAVVTVIDYGIDERAGALPYLVMELLQGETLAVHLARHGAMALSTVLPLLEQLASALDTAHARGVLHRDLKPSNVLLRHTDQGMEATLLDLGIARILDEEQDEPALGRPLGAGADDRAGDGTITQAGHTRAGVFVGTPAYAAPEVLAGNEPTEAADLFSFAVVVYEMLTGQHPFGHARTPPGERRQPRPPSALDPAVPEELDAPLLRGLQSDPDARPGSVTALVRALSRAAEQRQERRRRARLLARRRRVTPLVVVLATLAATLAGPAPPLRWLDRQLLDLGFTLAAPRPASERLLLVEIDDESVAAGSTPLAGRGEEAGLLLTALLEGGASAVGIDLLLPRQWSEQPAFQRLLIGHSERLVLGLSDAGEGRLVGQEVVSGLVTAALGPDRAGALLGVVDLDLDPDGVVRRFHTVLPSTGQTPYASFTAKLAGIAGATGDPALDDPRPRLIDYRVDTGTIRRVPWHDLATALLLQPQLARDRVVLVGATYAGAGDVFRRLPGPGLAPRRMNGVELQALVLHTLLAPRPARFAAPPLTIGLALLAALGVAWTLLGPAAAGLRVILAAMICMGSGSMALFALTQYGVWTGAAAPLLAGVCAVGLAAAARMHPFTRTGKEL